MGAGALRWTTERVKVYVVVLTTGFVEVAHSTVNPSSGSGMIEFLVCLVLGFGVLLLALTLLVVLVDALFTVFFDPFSDDVFGSVLLLLLLAISTAVVYDLRHPESQTQQEKRVEE